MQIYSSNRKSQMCMHHNSVMHLMSTSQQPLPGYRLHMAMVLPLKCLLALSVVLGWGAAQNHGILEDGDDFHCNGDCLHTCNSEQ